MMNFRYILQILTCLILFQACQKQLDVDYIISNAEIYDGTGEKPTLGGIAVKNDKIIKIGKTLSCNNCEIIDAQGMVVAPGFIDLHAHLEAIPIIPDAESALRMGVTTALGGPDGSSPLNIGKYLDSLESMKVGLNVAYLIGHNGIRLEVLHIDDRQANKEEMEEMVYYANKGMDDGAFGISTGLKYLPGAFADIEEVIELSLAISKKGGIYTSHLREEGLGLIEGVAEAITIAEKANIPVVLTHHKAIGLPMWGQSVKTLAMVDSARQAGLDVMVDQYPYTASYTGLSVLIEPWARAGGNEMFKERCSDPETRSKIKAGIKYNIENDRGGGDLKRIQIAKFNYKPELEGKTLYDWAIAEGLEPSSENGAELIIRAQLNGSGSAIYHAMSEEDVARIMKHPQTMIASDGRVTKFEQGFPHPRVYGTFPRVLGHYSRDLGYFPLEEALRKMTSLPAKRLGLADRGVLKEGMKADMVVFDKTIIIDKATFENPHQFPEGIVHVIVNGKFAIKDGELSNERSGEVLRGPAYMTKIVKP
jgi:dihydroorotase/N-acyl-D-amino-acid deacylase